MLNLDITVCGLETVALTLGEDYIIDTTETDLILTYAELQAFFEFDYTASHNDCESDLNEFWYSIAD